MGKDKADMGFINPPYNVGYAGRRTPRDKIKNDNLTKTEYTQFLDKLISSNKASLKRGASFYICYGSGYKQELQAILEKNQFEIRNHIIWAKNHFVISYARYKLKHEYILYCHQKDERDPWYGDKKQTTLWEIPKPNKNTFHPTQKPLAIIEKTLLNSSKKDDIVFDLCGGAGSTLLACEKLERAARIMEIEPQYIDATILRWQAHTKQPAISASHGITFDVMQSQQ